MSEPQMPEDDAETAAAIDWLAGDEGVWDAELEITPFPGAPVARTSGTSTNRMVAGRWLVTDIVTDSGYAGHGIYGWDPAARQFVAAWVDVMGGSIARGTGTLDDAGEVMTYEVAVEYEGRTARYREVTERRPDGTRLYRNLQPTPEGAEHETVRAVYSPRPG